MKYISHIAYAKIADDEDDLKIKICDPYVGKSINESVAKFSKRIAKKSYFKKTDFFKNHNVKHWKQRGWNRALEVYILSTLAQSNKPHHHDSFKHWHGDPYLDKISQNKSISMNLEQNLRLDHSKIFESLIHRRTRRHFKDRAVKFDDLNALLSGLKSFYNSDRFDDQICRLIKPFVMIFSVENIDSGIYYYDCINNKLILVKTGDYRSNLIKSMGKLHVPITSSFSVLFAADIKELIEYQANPNALSVLFMTGGRMSQRMVNVATPLNIGALCTPALVELNLSPLFDFDHHLCFNFYSTTFGFA